MNFRGIELFVLDEPDFVDELILEVNAHQLFGNFMKSFVLKINNFNFLNFFYILWAHIKAQLILTNNSVSLIYRNTKCQVSSKLTSALNAVAVVYIRMIIR